MNKLEKQVDYQTTNTYETLNTLGEQTKNVWIILHGIGFLSRYFISYFDQLNPEENYIIAPQAPAKYYLKNEYKHVGASWLTKENTTLEIHNVITYLNTVLRAEALPENCRLIVFGFSQGVSIATRWVAQEQLKCDELVLYAGGIPDELTADHFAFLKQRNSKITVLVGDKDEYITPEVLEVVSKKIDALFQGRAKQLIFKGGHEMKKELIQQISDNASVS